MHAIIPVAKRFYGVSMVLKVELHSLYINPACGGTAAPSITSANPNVVKVGKLLSTFMVRHHKMWIVVWRTILNYFFNAFDICIDFVFAE